MATYRNRNDDTIIRGSEFKLNISVDVIDENANCVNDLVIGNDVT